MATLFVTEYQGYSTAGTLFQAALEPEITTQTRAVGAAIQTAAFSKNTYLIRVHTDVVCSVLVGANPTATTTSKRLAANQTEYFAVKPGQILSVISNT